MPSTIIYNLKNNKMKPKTQTLLMAVTFVAFFQSASLQGFAQSDKYAPAMEKTLALFGTAKTNDDYQGMAAAFTRIGDAEKTQWLPYYYAGLALSTNGWIDKTVDKDANSTRINELCDKADANATLPADKAEILALRNMSATQQMLVDPPSRYMTYGVEAHKDLEKGMQLDPNNPRLYYLQGMSLFNTPPAFGGGKDKAKVLFQKSLDLYKTATVKPMYPGWGENETKQKLAECL
jgi:hypothetical protein